MSSNESYICMPRPRIERAGHAVRAVLPGDIEAIRRWRNAQMDVLRQSSKITSEQQTEYFARHVWPLFESATPATILLILEQDGTPIGYGGLVHVTWEHRRAEVSFLLAPQLGSDATVYADKFQIFLSLLKELAFVDLGFDRLWTETYAFRTHHIAILESAGFEIEGRLRNHVRVDGRPVDSLVHGCLRTAKGTIL